MVSAYGVTELSLEARFRSDAMIRRVSQWFRTYGYAGVYDGLIVGAVPVDESDASALIALGVSRVLNLVEDSEYKRGERRRVERSFAHANIEERRLHTQDYGNISPELFDEAGAQINAWLDEGHVVYLHCRAGWQRSATVAAGAIVLRDEVTPAAALERVQTLKPTADPLPHQRADLQRWWESRSPATRPREGAE
jgi:protein-tyrosine phosphatase